LKRIIRRASAVQAVQCRQQENGSAGVESKEMKKPLSFLLRERGFVAAMAGWEGGWCLCGRRTGRGEP